MKGGRMKIREVQGTITLEDGSTSEFLVTGGGYTQWGADTERLGETVDLLAGFEETFDAANDEEVG